MLPKGYKKPKCKLLGEDGNAFLVIGKVSSTLKKAGYKDLVEQYRKEAMSGDYDNLLNVSMKYVAVS